KDLQETMQDLTGIVRTETEMREALERINNFKAAADRAAVSVNREYNPGWHTALDLKNLLTVSEAITLAALERKESRGAQFRDDYPAKDAEYAKFNIVVRRSSDGRMQLERLPVRDVPDELKKV